MSDPDRPLDAGLLSPVRAGTAVESVTSDEAWFAAMLAAEAGLARAQAALGLVPPEHAATITEVARSARFDVLVLARRARDNANPVVALVDALTGAVAAADPSAATYVHRGSTSQDVYDTGLMLVTRDALDIVLTDLARVTDALARLAAEHRDTPMPGRTLTQHAVPVTFGLKAAGWLLAVANAADRLAALRRDGLYAQLGGAAGTLAGYVEYARLAGRDPDAYAADLMSAYAAEVGLREPVLPWHTARGPLAEVAAALAVAVGALGKIAGDVATLTRTEIGEVTESTAAGKGASSAMPHKRNPVLATMVTSAARQMPFAAASVLACLVAEDERSAGGWQAEWEPYRECLRLAGGAAATAADLVEGLRVAPDRMDTNLAIVGELVASERVTAVLAPTLGRAEARRLVTDLCARAVDEGRPLSELLAGVLPDEQVRELLDPRRYTGAAGLLVDRALAAYRKG